MQRVRQGLQSLKVKVSTRRLKRLGHKKSQPRSCGQRAQCDSSKPPTFWGTAGKSARGRPFPPPFWGRSVKVTPARAHTKTKFLRENLGVPRATGRPRVTRPGSFQDLKEAYETYGSPRVTRRPRRPKRPRVMRRPRRPKRPTGGTRVRDLGL